AGGARAPAVLAGMRVCAWLRANANVPRIPCLRQTGIVYSGVAILPIIDHRPMDGLQNCLQSCPPAIPLCCRPSRAGRLLVKFFAKNKRRLGCFGCPALPGICIVAQRTGSD